MSNTNTLVQFDPNNFDYTQYEAYHVGSVHIGNHCIYDFEVYKLNGQLWFLCHDDFDQLTTYRAVKKFFKFKGDINYDGETLEDQLKRCGAI